MKAFQQKNPPYITLFKTGVEYFTHHGATKTLRCDKETKCKVKDCASPDAREIFNWVWSQGNELPLSLGRHKDSAVRKKAQSVTHISL